MTPDELRALADALPEGVHWSDPITPEMLAEAIKRFCADAQPVAWVQSNHLDEARRSVFMARLAPTQIYQDYVPLYTHPAPAAPQVAASFYTEDGEFVGITDAPIKKIRVEDDGTLHVFIDHWPQAEPSDPYDAIWNALQEIDSVAVFLPTFAVKHEGGIEAFTKNIVEAINDACKLLQPQTEPKREPLGDWRIAEEVKNRQIYGDGADAFYDGVRWAESTHGIGGSDAE